MEEKPRLPEDFLATLGDLEAAYLRETDPILQSGFHGGPERWRRERGIVLRAVDGDGDFLDVGCANGYLVECLAAWAKEGGTTLVPYGVDQGAGLVELARRRFPEHAGHFWVANAWDWVPPRRFRYVYTLTEFVPEALLRDYLARAMEVFVAEDGRLIVGAYGSNSRREPARDITRLLEGLGFPVAGTATRGDLPVVHVAWVDADACAQTRAGRPRG